MDQKKRPHDADEAVKEKRIKFEDFFDLEAKARDLTTDDGCRFIYIPKLLTSSGANVLRSFLDGLAEDQWATGVSCFGHMVPRLIRWYGPEAYRFAGRNWQPHSYEPVLASFQLHLQDYLRSLTGDETLTFASCLVNKYRHGQDSISKHSDDEREFGVDPAIASISLGTTRTFHVARKSKNGKPDDHLKFALGEGSLLFMGGKTQQLFEHWIPKEPNAIGVRYNCTFRPYVGSPA
jgi:alkylated DNA repair dioxygenase AlkB